MDDLGPRPSEDLERVELVARAICAADQYTPDPDALIYSGVPYTVRYGYMAYGEPLPLWRSYVSMAQAAIDAEWLEAKRAQNLNKEPTT